MAPDQNTQPSELIDAIKALVSQLSGPRVNQDDELWTSDDIANYLKLATYTIERRVVTRPEFPAPLQPCLTGARAVKRWFAGEVITWARQNRSKLPSGRARRKAA
ncbi:hypothetical protein [Phytopseudomonas seleniipraecipitans]|uniref:Transcriptional regulator, AlpA family n=1 Tax=Phytopseudomonas seleniipraecipitans TaxID=640205 RepID=A0A1G7JFE6_9GAMM|nr:hypothetical protein [Pseudomonas seleniipraecipitans]SDF23595.1 hypothetical protein SAMN05216381_1102 [Pseudomonas seleniipraecipitans]